MILPKLDIEVEQVGTFREKSKTEVFFLSTKDAEEIAKHLYDLRELISDYELALEFDRRLQHIKSILLGHF